ncbi:MAG: prolipoprotein diacylglyceryl transferase family protein [Myxococcota bacterium]|nr:prolipoprotein diacylglyceryl transferase family protein [Myxococcota bacterium]
MPVFLYIPWWKPEPVRIPVPDVAREWFPSLADHVPVHAFGMLVALGVVIGAWVAAEKAKRDGMHPSVMNELAGHMFIGGFVLGHVLDAIFYHWDVVEQNPWFLLELPNGLSSFGGFVGAVVGALIWKLRRGHSILAFGDMGAFAFPFAWFFGRLGCFTAHDHPGRVTDFFLGVEGYQVYGGTPPWQVRHDLGLYEVFWCLAMMPLVLWLGRKKRRHGFYLALVPILYAPVRFGLDFLRATDIQTADPRPIAGLTPGHFGAVMLLLAGLGVAARVLKGPKPSIAADARWPEPIPTPDASDSPDAPAESEA